MLDGTPLDSKIMVARMWFTRAQQGEFKLNGRDANVFVDLLQECETGALLLATQAHIDAATIALLRGQIELLKPKPPAALTIDLPANVTVLSAVREKRKAGARPFPETLEQELPNDHSHR